MFRTEFSVKNVETSIEEKAVLHTYLTTGSLMIQGRGKYLFYNSNKKDVIERIMKLFSLKSFGKA